MKLPILFALIATCPLVASATSLFAFTDHAGYEKCLGQDHLIEESKTDGGSEKRFMNQGEVQGKCIQAAVALLEPKKKDSKALLQFIESTRRMAGPLNALPLVEVLDRGTLAECNNSDAYAIMLGGFEHPQEYPSVQHSYFNEAKKIAKTCMASAEFKKDFLDEIKSDNSYVRTNVCAFLKSEKISSSCH